MTDVPTLPAGDYAIVECLGHRTLVGRCEEVERFGTKMLSIEPIYSGALLPAVLIGGGSLYAFTPCSAAVALERCHKTEWDLPVSLRATLPQPALPAPEDGGEDPGWPDSAVIDRETNDGIPF